MGSVNRDFVFTQLQDGEQTHNSHMDTHADVHAVAWGRGGGQVTYCNRVDRKHARTCRCFM